VKLYFNRCQLHLCISLIILHIIHPPYICTDWTYGIHCIMLAYIVLNFWGFLGPCVEIEGALGPMVTSGRCPIWTIPLIRTRSSDRLWFFQAPVHPAVRTALDVVRTALDSGIWDNGARGAVADIREYGCGLRCTPLRPSLTSFAVISTL